MSDSPIHDSYFKETLYGLYALCALLGCLLLWQCLFSVGTQQIGVIRRFGKIQSVVTDGLFFCFPPPIDRTEKISARARQLTFKDPNFRVITRDGKLLSVPGGSLDYAPDLQNPSRLVTFLETYTPSEREKLLNNLYFNALRICAAEEDADVILRGNARFNDRIADALSRTFAELDVALMCQKVSTELRMIPEAKDAYDRLVSAGSEREKVLNAAHQSADALATESRVRCEKVIAQAHSKAQEINAQAQAKSNAFLIQLADYERQPQLYRQRRLNEVYFSILRGATYRYVLSASPGEKIILRVPTERVKNNSSQQDGAL